MYFLWSRSVMLMYPNKHHFLGSAIMSTCTISLSCSLAYLSSSSRCASIYCDTSVAWIFAFFCGRLFQVVVLEHAITISCCGNFMDILPFLSWVLGAHDCQRQMSVFQPAPSLLLRSASEMPQRLLISSHSIWRNHWPLVRLSSWKAIRLTLWFSCLWRV